MDVPQMALEQIRLHNEFTTSLGAALIRVITGDEPGEAVKEAVLALAALPRADGLAEPGYRAIRVVRDQMKGGDADG